MTGSWHHTGEGRSGGGKVSAWADSSGCGWGGGQGNGSTFSINVNHAHTMNGDNETRTINYTIIIWKRIS